MAMRLPTLIAIVCCAAGVGMVIRFCDGRNYSLPVTSDVRSDVKEARLRTGEDVSRIQVEKRTADKRTVIDVRNVDNEAIAGVEIIGPDGTQLGVTGESGLLPLKRGADISRILTSKSGYRPHKFIIDNPDHDGGRITLRIQRECSMVGQVLDQNANPLPGVAIVVANGALAQGNTGLYMFSDGLSVSLRGDRLIYAKKTLTGSDGRFELRGLAPGPHTISWNKFGFVPGPRQIGCKIGLHRK